MYYFKTFLTNNSIVNDSASFTVRNVFNTNPDINNSGFTVNSSTITVPSGGLYECMVNCYFTSSVARSNVGVSFEIDGVTQDEVSASNYIRSGSGHNEASTHLCSLFTLSSGSTVKLAFAYLGSTGTVTLEGSNSSISLYQYT